MGERWSLYLAAESVFVTVNLCFSENTDQGLCEPGTLTSRWDGVSGSILKVGKLRPREVLLPLGPLWG